MRPIRNGLIYFSMIIESTELIFTFRIDLRTFLTNVLIHESGLGTTHFQIEFVNSISKMSRMAGIGNSRNA